MIQAFDASGASYWQQEAAWCCVYCYWLGWSLAESPVQQRLPRWNRRSVGVVWQVGVELSRVAFFGSVSEELHWHRAVGRRPRLGRFC